MKHPVPEGSLATTPTAHNLAQSLRKMLEVYWGDGDGAEPPEFIRQAQILVESYDNREPITLVG